MRSYIYADESGNFDFSDGPGATRYFILTTVTVADDAIERDLQELRRELAWEGEPLAAGFHATNDKQRVRDRVFAAISRHDFRVDATILEKRKINPARRTPERLYGLAWYSHLSSLAHLLARESNELLVIAAAIGTNDVRSNFHATVGAIARAIAPTATMRAEIWGAASSPLLQAADYCAWALQRKWEREPSDTRSYDLIQDRIASEFDVLRGSIINPPEH